MTRPFIKRKGKPPTHTPPSPPAPLPGINFSKADPFFTKTTAPNRARPFDRLGTFQTKIFNGTEVGHHWPHPDSPGVKILTDHPDTPEARHRVVFFNLTNTQLNGLYALLRSACSSKASSPQNTTIFNLSSDLAHGMVQSLGKWFRTYIALRSHKAIQSPIFAAYVPASTFLDPPAPPTPTYARPTMLPPGLYLARFKNEHGAQIWKISDAGVLSEASLKYKDIKPWKWDSYWGKLIFDLFQSSPSRLHRLPDTYLD